jgi:hypothetical protein
MRQPGDLIILQGSGDFENFECIIMEVDPVDGRVTKMKAAVPDDRLGKMGFILEGEDWVAVEWDYNAN